MTPAEAAEQLRALVAELEARLSFVKTSAYEWSVAEDAYRCLHAQEFLKAQGSVQARKATADLATSKARQRAHLADAMLRAAHAALGAKRDELKAWQSVVSLVKQEMDFARTGPEMRP